MPDFLKCFRVGLWLPVCLMTVLVGMPDHAQASVSEPALMLGGEAKPDVMILTPEKIDTPALDAAAADLEACLQQILGKERVTRIAWQQGVVVPSTAVPIHIGLARPDAARLLAEHDMGEQGFVLHVTGQGIEVLGGDDWGTVYGVYELLEQMGVRWLFPGEWGLVLPAPGPVTIRQQQMTDQPAFAIREMHQYAMRAPTQFGDWARRSRQYVCGYSGHSGLLLNQRKAHPEWFALVDGKRMNMDSHPKLCHANEQMVQAAIAQVLGWIEQRMTSDRITDRQVPIAIARQVRMISISPTDGGGFCECEDCVRMGSVSDRLQIFANTVGSAVAQKYPDYKIGYYGAYSQAQSPPTVKAGPNVIVFATTWQKSFFLPLESLRNRPFRDKIAQFSRMCPDMGIRDFDGMYSVWWGWGPMSLISAHQADYPWYLAHGVKGFITEAQDHWAAGGQSYYVTTRLWWNPHADVEAIKRDFVEKGFGAAAAPMWRYYEYVNQHQTAMSEGVLNAMRQELEAAHTLARRPDVIHRIDMLRLYMLLNDTLNKAQAGQASPEQLKLAVRLGRSLTGRNIIGKGMVGAIEKLYTGQAQVSPESLDELPRCTPEEYQQVLASMTLPEPAETFAPWRQADEMALRPLEAQGAAFDPSMTSWLRYGPMTMLLYAKAGQVVNVSYETGRGSAPISYELKGPQLELIHQGSIEPSSPMTFTASQEGVYTLSVATPGTWVRLKIDAQWVVYRAANAQDRFHPFRGGMLYFYVPRGTKRFAIIARTFPRERYSLRVWWPHESEKPIFTTPIVADSSFRAYPIDVPPGADGQVWRMLIKGDKKELFLQGIPPLFASEPQRLLILKP